MSLGLRGIVRADEWEPPPASFGIARITISPEQVSIGEIVAVTALVFNAGGQPGDYELVLKINGEVESTKEITLWAMMRLCESCDVPCGQSSSEEVTFEVARYEPGTYLVEVDGHTGSFVVREGTGSVTSPDASPAMPDSAELISEKPLVTMETSPPLPDTIPPNNSGKWPLIAGIATAILVQGLLIYLLARRSTRRSPDG